jgi:methylated-DNA-[protein]-cysteine S-methyltransferase
MVYFIYLDTPIHTILLTSDGAALTGLYMDAHLYGPTIGKDWIQDDEAVPFVEAKRQLLAYFVGELTEFTLPLKMHGTDFQRMVWEELTRIPYGVTISYGELAKRIGNPNASRAVGLANGHNPISIIVPCHRVIGANGQLTGYGGGLPRKQLLLTFETAVLVKGPQACPPLQDGTKQEEKGQTQLSLF